MKLEFLEEFYVEELRDLLDAEKQLVQALQKMAKAASSDQLRHAFEQHAEQTEGHAKRLEQILQSHGDSKASKRCEGMHGIIREGEQMLKQDADPEILDVALITTAQKVEHYEIAGYGCATAYAKQLGLNEEAGLLHQTLEEEKQTDGRLTALAKNLVNPVAAEGDILEEESERPGVRQ